MRTIKETITSNKGFYLGDLCYVLNQDAYDKIWGEQYGYSDGLIPVDDNSFVVGSTWFGDGVYHDSDDHEYGVDAGNISMVPWELIDVEQMKKDYGYISSDEFYLMNHALGRFVQGTEAVFEMAEVGVFKFKIKQYDNSWKTIYLNTKEE